MGLTHSWERPTELPANEFASAVRDIQKALARLDVPLAGFDGSGKPQFADDHLIFSGADGVTCEPFEIHQTEFDREGRATKISFCKTRRLPYDLAVKVALIVMKFRLGASFEVFSDESAESWIPARRVVQESLGYGNDFLLDQKS